MPCKLCKSVTGEAISSDTFYHFQKGVFLCMVARLVRERSWRLITIRSILCLVCMSFFHIFVGCIWVPQFLSHAPAIAVEQETDFRA